MKAILIMLPFLLATAVAEAQEITSTKVAYYAWMYRYDDQKPVKGVIFETNDSTIKFIEASNFIKNRVVIPYTISVIPVTTIEKIRVRKRGAPLKGILVGGGVGAVVIGAISYADGDDECDAGGFCFLMFTAEEKAVFGATLGVIPGLIIGTIVGHSKRKFQINGDEAQYKTIRNELKPYALSGQ